LCQYPASIYSASIKYGAGRVGEGMHLLLTALSIYGTMAKECHT